MNIEVIGIIATLFVLASFIINDIYWVRVVNVIGAILFVIYGFYIGAISTWILNSVLIIIHSYYLTRK